MRQCTNPDIGRMLVFYEFGRLSSDEKEKLENHLLECDLCYQELYEFSPAIKTIRKNIKNFKKVARLEKTTLRQVLDYFLTPPKTVRLAFAAAVLFIMAIVSYKIFGPRQEALMTTESIGNNKRSHPGKPHRLIPNEPEEMELKATQDVYRDTVLHVFNIPERKNRILQSLTMSKERNTIRISWARILEAKSYSFSLFENENGPPIFYQSNIRDTTLSISLFLIKNKIIGKLFVELIDGSRFDVQKQLYY